MILEVADIRIPPGKNAEFEAAIGAGLATVIAARATGYIAHKVQRGIESRERYLLMIWWDTLENHTVDFRQGPLFAEWRSLHRPVPRGAAARRALRARASNRARRAETERAVMNGTQKQTPKLFFAAGRPLRTVRPPALLAGGRDMDTATATTLYAQEDRGLRRTRRERAAPARARGRRARRPRSSRPPASAPRTRSSPT